MIDIEDAYSVPLNDEKTEGFLSAGRQGTVNDESLAEVLKVRSNRDFVWSGLGSLLDHQ